MSKANAIEMVLVPAEPTAEMIEAFWGKITMGVNERAAVEAYKLMLAAAQKVMYDD